MKTNSYNIFEEKHADTILYHAVSTDEEQVKELAEENNIDLNGLTIEVEKINVKDELGRPIKPFIEDALIQH
jgi:hypothetical protein